MHSPGIAALVLAAGGGNRLGGGKLQRLWRGRSLAAHVLALAEQAGCLHPLVCVVGFEADALCRTFSAAGLRGSWEQADAAAPCKGGPPALPRWRAVYNGRWSEGQSASLRAGVEFLAGGVGQGVPAGVMVLLGDMPCIRAETVRLLAEAHLAAGDAVQATAPLHGGRRGNPVVLGAGLFPALLSITGDAGARDLLRDLGSRLNLVPVADPGVLFDVDSPADYAALTGRRSISP